MKQKSITILQHVPFEGPAHILTWALKQNMHVHIVKVYESAYFPENDQTDGLVIMGGPMSVHDTDTIRWLPKEKAYIRSFLESGKPILGICLGAQLIADVAGAQVYKNQEKELGWWPVSLSLEAKNHELFKDFPLEINVFHWHGETFTLPEKSILLMSSEACQNQAFLLNNNVIGLQFHFELDEKAMETSMPYIRKEWQESPWVQDEKTIQKGFKHMETNHLLLEKLLDYIFLSAVEM